MIQNKSIDRSIEYLRMGSYPKLSKTEKLGIYIPTLNLPPIK